MYLIPDINRRDSVLIGFTHIQEDIVFFRLEIDKHPYNGICNEYDYRLQESPLYDFSLLIGDSFDYNCSRRVFPVSDIDAIELGGITRKKITFMHDLFLEEIADEWIEGMGSVNGLFYGKEDIPARDDYGKYFVCFTLSDELIYLNPRYSECPVPQFNAIPEVNANPLKVFPNPMKSAATIQSGLPLQLIQIYDISGVLLWEQACRGELQATINRQSLLQGSYFIKVTLQTGEIRTEKLIIQ